MKPGLLYVGHSENFSDSRPVRLRGKTIYERV